MGGTLKKNDYDLASNNNIREWGCLPFSNSFPFLMHWDQHVHCSKKKNIKLIKDKLIALSNGTFCSNMHLYYKSNNRKRKRKRYSTPYVYE